MNNYALPPGRIELEADLTGMGDHTDFGIVTVLWADRVAGLQVLGPDRVWHDVQPEPGALLVNLSDLMARWTGEPWVSVQTAGRRRHDPAAPLGRALPRRQQRRADPPSARPRGRRDKGRRAHRGQAGRLPRRLVNGAATREAARIAAAAR